MSKPSKEAIRSIFRAERIDEGVGLPQGGLSEIIRSIQGTLNEKVANEPTTSVSFPSPVESSKPDITASAHFSRKAR